MNQGIITEQQARQITGGHTPLVPVEYEEAIRSLQACITLDEAKYWDNKADALAAWAKIYHSPEAERKAKQLKLHAFRRMGQIAEELRPTKRNNDGTVPLGASSLLHESGLKHHEAAQALTVARIPKNKFESYVSDAATLYRVRKENFGIGVIKANHRSDAWRWFSHTGPRLSNALSAMRTRKASEVAEQLSPDEAETARQILTEVMEWLDEFEHCLSRNK